MSFGNSKNEVRSIGELDVRLDGDLELPQAHHLWSVLLWDELVETEVEVRLLGMVIQL